jgi:hypothetical protein
VSDPAAQLRALVYAHRPGQIITRNTLRILLGRGTAGHPGEALLSLLSDQEAFSTAVCGNDALRELVYRRGDGRFARRRWSITERRTGVLDLNNLVWTFRYSAAGDPPRLAPLFDLLRHLRELSVEQIVGIADANMIHTVADAELLPEFAGLMQQMHTAPSGMPADELILTAAEDAASNGGALVFSNDLFRQWRKGSAWRRRNIWRILVPVRPPAKDDESSTGRQFDLGDPGWELMDPPPGST